MLNNKELIEKSFDVDMSNQYRFFEKYLKNDAVLLDVNFKSGRDSLYFQMQGYDVYSIDENEEFIKHGIEIGLKNVTKTSVFDIKYVDQFDAIWCGSLPLTKVSDIKNVLLLFSKALKEHGVLLLSFEMSRGTRGSSIINRVSNLLREINLRIEKFLISTDERDGELKQWINVIFIKQTKIERESRAFSLREEEETNGTLEEREIPSAIIPRSKGREEDEPLEGSVGHYSLLMHGHQSKAKVRKERRALKLRIIRRSRIYYSLVAEKTIKRNSNFIVNFLMCTRDNLDILDMLKERFIKPQTQTEESDHKVKKGNQVTIVLSSPNAPYLKDEESFVWDGEYHVCSLSGFLSNDFAPNNLLLNVDILVNGIRVSRLKSIIDLENNRPGELVFSKEDVRKIFFSYSSQDRRAVLSIVKKIDQMYNHRIDFFLDVLSLRLGDKWKKRIYEEIDDSDTFCLVWSKNACKSEWVDKEWRYALLTKGLEAFAPINLDAGSNLAPIPAELEEIHFGCYPLILE